MGDLCFVWCVFVVTTSKIKLGGSKKYFAVVVLFVIINDWRRFYGASRDDLDASEWKACDTCALYICLCCCCAVLIFDIKNMGFDKINASYAEDAH